MVGRPRLGSALHALLCASAWTALVLAAGCSGGTTRPPQPAPPVGAASTAQAKAKEPAWPVHTPAAANPLPMDPYASAVVPRWLAGRRPLQHPPFTPHWYTPKVDPLFRHRLTPQDLDAMPPGARQAPSHPPDDIPASAYRGQPGGASRWERPAGAAGPHDHIKDYNAVVPLLHGIASWYGPGFHGKLTASGEVYDQNAMTAAHPTLPLGTVIRVTNEQNGRVAWVRVNDRGPYKKGRVLDLSRAAARRLGMLDEGTAPVRIQVMRWPRDTDTRLGLRAYSQYVVQVAAYPQPGKAEAAMEHMRHRFRWADFRLDPRPGGALAVVSGPYDDHGSAQRVAHRLQQAGVTSLVRRYRK